MQNFDLLDLLVMRCIARILSSNLLFSSSSYLAVMERFFKEQLGRERSNILSATTLQPKSILLIYRME
jgi:hypothetical protein